MSDTSRSLATPPGLLSGRRLGLLTACVASIVAVLLVGARLPAFSSEDFKLATSAQTERVSELYFSDPDRLPGSVTAGVPNTVSFVIVNGEGEAYTYTYLVRLIDLGVPADSQVVASGSVKLADGDRTTVNVSFALPEPGQRKLLVVQLRERSETLRLHVAS